MTRFQYQSPQMFFHGNYWSKAGETYVGVYRLDGPWSNKGTIYPKLKRKVKTKDMLKDII